MTTAVVFGSNSWLAANFIRAARGTFSEVIAIDRSRLSGLNSVDFSLHLRIDRPIPDGDYFFLLNLLRSKADLVFFLFAWAGTPRSSVGENSQAIFTANNWITTNYCRLINDVLPAQVVFVSSAGAIYPQSSNATQYDELSHTFPTTPYGSQKLSCECSLEKICSFRGMPLASLRVSSAYGYNPAIPDQGVANVWLHSALNGHPLKIYNSLNSEINFVADYQISSVLSSVVSKRLSGIYNLGSHRSTSLRSLLEGVEELFGEQVLHTKIFKDDLRIVRINSQKLYDSIGYVVEPCILSDLKIILDAMS